MDWMYKVGDRVIVREDLHTGNYETELPVWWPCEVVRGMLTFAGQTATITEVCGSGRYSIDLDGGNWYWVSGMFQGFEADDAQFELAMDELF